eukprot:Hpha_TRINITY_DN16803_c0_g1::TRINITY_DN16803_c0_g1_i1::g.150551::m.150551
MLSALSVAALAGGGCADYYASLNRSDLAAPARWCREGAYFTFASPANANRTAQVFSRCTPGAGEAAPVVFTGHGWPTSSYDYAPLTEILEGKGYRVCAVDYVGAGFSDKPGKSWAYHIRDHAQTIHDFLVHEGIKEFVYVTHDEGSSVGLALLDRYEAMSAAERPYTITHHVIMDGSIYLPLANLSSMQEALLSNITGPVVEKLIFPGMLADGIGHAVYNPPLSKEETANLESIFAFNEGTHMLHNNIQYLQDRKEHEDHWLDVLHRSPINATLIWGMLDPVATPAIADYVWDNYLASRPNASATYHRLANASHYLQVDHTKDVAAIILAEIGH